KSSELPDFVFPETGPPDHAVIQEALRLLALTHDRFIGRVAELPDELPALAPDYRVSCVALALSMGLLELCHDTCAMKEFGRMDDVLSEQAAILKDPNAHTLLHGDFHLANIAYSDRGVRILDWGEAVIGPAAWDLALCPEEDIDFYLSARRASNSVTESAA